MLSVKKSRQKNFGAEFVIAFGVAESPEGDGWYAYPARGYFSMKKSNQKSFRAPP